MPHKVTLNDGTELDAQCELDGRFLFLYIYDRTVDAGTALFRDPEKTCRIVFDSYGHRYIYEGYTELFLANGSGGNCNLVMRRGSDA